MSLRNWAGRRVIFPLIEKLSSTRCWSISRSTKIEHDKGYLDQNLKNKKLAKLMQQASAIPAWKDLPTSIEQFSNTPITYKANYINGFPEKVVSSINKNEHQSLFSGGTSERMTVVTDFEKRDHLRALENLNVEYGHLSLWARKTLDIPPSACNVTCGLTDRGPEDLRDFAWWLLKNKRWKQKDTMGDLRGRIERQILMRRLTAQPLTPGSWDHLCAQIDPLLNQLDAGGFEVLRGYPLFLYWIAIRAKERNLSLPRLKRVIPYGGLASSCMTVTISNLLDVEFINLYGTGEVGSIGVGEVNHALIFPYQNDIILEIVDDHGKSINEIGVKGNILVTDLNNFAMPIVRYAVGDVGSWEHHPNGRKGVLLHGRTVENIRLLDGSTISPRELQDCVFSNPNVLNYCLKKRKDGNFHFRFVQVDPTKEIDFVRLTKLLNTDSISFECVPFIEPVSSGKYLHVTFQNKEKTKISRDSHTQGNVASQSIKAKDAHIHFPLRKKISPYGHPAIYLDNAATAPKPQCVIDAVNEVMTSYTGNVHRGAHFLGDGITDKFDAARSSVARLIGANPNEIIFLRNTTECINFIAQQYTQNRVINSVSDHHANLLPWKNKITISAGDDGSLSMSELAKVAQQNPGSLISLPHVSNVTGNIIDINAVVNIARNNQCEVLIDAAQSVPHMPISVHEMNIDYLVFSGHKIGAPSGVGVLWVHPRALHNLKPVQWGGAMVEDVSLESFTIKNSPLCFEPGTPAIESIVGLGAAANWLLSIGMNDVQKYVDDLTQYARKSIVEQHGNILLGDPFAPGPVSLNIKNKSPHELARTLSERYGICMRAGFHCAQPLHSHLGSQGTLRLSPWLINTREDIDVAIDALGNIV